jgi:hypothetical protein
VAEEEDHDKQANESGGSAPARRSEGPTEPDIHDTISPGQGRAEQNSEPPVSLERDETSEAVPDTKKTILVSSSSKARARIIVCNDCGGDNVSGARFCENCGADLLLQQSARLEEESQKRLSQFAERSRRSRAAGGGLTVIRGGGLQDIREERPQPVEKKTYHSQYVPAGRGKLDVEPKAFQYKERPAHAHSMGPIKSYAAAPAEQRMVQDEETETSFVVGIIVAAVLFVLFVGLVAALVVILLM